MQIQDIDHILPQPRARLIQLAADILGARTTGIGNLGGDQQTVTRVADQLAQDLFAAPVGIDPGGVEMGDACSAAGGIHLG